MNKLLLVGVFTMFFIIPSIVLASDSSRGGYDNEYEDNLGASVADNSDIYSARRNANSYDDYRVDGKYGASSYDDEEEIPFLYYDY